MNTRFPEQSTNEVKVRGEPLDPILWQGKQWAVTEHGIEQRDGTYHILAIDVIRKNNERFTWVHHMQEKNWVDISDFEMALAAFSMLFDANGKRNKTPAPRQLTEYEIEEYALFHGNTAYEAAKSRAMRGEV